MEDSATPNIQTARVICGALMIGVVVLWAFAFVMSAGQGGFGSGEILDPLVTLAIVLAIALSSFGAALFFRGRALAAVSPASGSSEAAGPARGKAAIQLLRNLIIAWALLEGQALVAGVLFLITGEASLLIISALVFVLGFSFTFPKAEWFERAQRSEPAQL